ncbi:MAG: ABC transporter permease, partial [Clostridia bacterium]|nr:ABC transporter permease [Clostridia bacterium]
VTPLKFWRRKIPLTVAWVLVITAMTVFLNTGYSLLYTTGTLPEFVEENNKTVALIGESHVLKEDEGGIYASRSTAITQKEYDILASMDSVKDIHINKITGAYSDRFYADLSWEPYGGYQLGSSNEPYNNGIVVGRVITAPEDVLDQTELSVNGADGKTYDRKQCQVSIAVEELFLFNDVFTDNVFSDFKYVELLLVYYSDSEAPLLKNGDRGIFYIDNYRCLTNSPGPAATCMTGNIDEDSLDRGLQIIRTGDRLVSFAAVEAEFETVKIPYVTPDGSEIYYTRDELTLLKGLSDETHIPIMTKFEGELDDFLAKPENEAWQNLFTHLEMINGCMPVIATDCLEGQYAFVTDRAKIIEGRHFTEEEYKNSEKVLIISRTVAEKGGIKAGDTVKLSQFLLDRESGRCDDYFEERKSYYHPDYVININPTIGNFVSTPRFVTTDEEFTVVGIYDQSEEWEENMFSFTPVTVFMPLAAQIDGGYGGLAYYEDDDDEAVRCGAEGVGLVVEVKNGMMDRFREEIAETDMAEFFLVFDQGYEDSIISARLLASMGRSLFVIVFCGWLILLVLYVLLYQFKQNKTLGIMRSVGATPMGAGWYAFICGIIPAALGIAIGCTLGMLLIGTVQSKIFALILSQGDIAEESTRFSVLLSQNMAEPAMLIPVSILQLLAFAVVLFVCAFIVASRPPRKLSSD